MNCRSGRHPLGQGRSGECGGRVQRGQVDIEKPIFEFVGWVGLPEGRGIAIDGVCGCCTSAADLPDAACHFAAFLGGMGEEMASRMASTSLRYLVRRTTPSASICTNPAGMVQLCHFSALSKLSISAQPGMVGKASQAVKATRKRILVGDAQRAQQALTDLIGLQPYFEQIEAGCRSCPCASRRPSEGAVVRQPAARTIGVRLAGHPENTPAVRRVR